MINIAFFGSANTILAPHPDTFNTNGTDKNMCPGDCASILCMNIISGGPEEDSLILEFLGDWQSLCGCEAPTCPIETSAFLPPHSLFFFLLLFNSEATMTGDKLAISPRATHRGQQKMNCPRSILYSLSLTVTLCSPAQTNAKHAPLEKKKDTFRSESEFQNLSYNVIHCAQ